jgi:hypothetical protein
MNRLFLEDQSTYDHEPVAMPEQIPYEEEELMLRGMDTGILPDLRWILRVLPYPLVESPF